MHTQSDSEIMTTTSTHTHSNETVNTMDSTTMITNADQITDDHDVFFFTDAHGVRQGTVLGTSLEEAAAKMRELASVKPEQVIGLDYHRYHLDDALEILAEIGDDADDSLPIKSGNSLAEGEITEATEMDVEGNVTREARLLNEMADTLTREIVLTGEDGKELYSGHHNVEYQHEDHYKGIRRKQVLPKIAMALIEDEVDGEVHFSFANVAGDVKDLGEAPPEFEEAGPEEVEFHCSDEIGSVEVHAKVLR